MASLKLYATSFGDSSDPRFPPDTSTRTNIGNVDNGNWARELAVAAAAEAVVSNECPDGYEGSPTQGSSIETSGPATGSLYSYMKGLGDGACSICTSGKYLRFIDGARSCTSCPIGKYSWNLQQSDSSTCER